MQARAKSRQRLRRLCSSPGARLPITCCRPPCCHPQAPKHGRPPAAQLWAPALAAGPRGEHLPEEFRAAAEPAARHRGHPGSQLTSGTDAGRSGGARLAAPGGTSQAGPVGCCCRKGRDFLVSHCNSGPAQAHTHRLRARHGPPRCAAGCLSAGASADTLCQAGLRIPAHSFARSSAIRTSAATQRPVRDLSGSPCLSPRPMVAARDQ